MSDIVTRLRYRPLGLSIEAADEIERLRRELAEARARVLEEAAQVAIVYADPIIAAALRALASPSGGER